MKQTINLGAYGWLQAPWLESFYPQDLPEDWRLSYYSNEFNSVLVPADYWQGRQIADCENWLDCVHPDFQFCIECHERMFDMVSLADLNDALKILKPQLSGLVFLDDQPLPVTLKEQLSCLLDTLDVDVFGGGFSLRSQPLWQWPAKSQNIPQSARFALIEDDLTDLRLSRARIEPFTRQLDNVTADAVAATMIVSHPGLQPADLTKFRSVLEIMGY